VWLQMSNVASEACSAHAITHFMQQCLNTHEQHAAHTPARSSCGSRSAHRSWRRPCCPSRWPSSPVWFPCKEGVLRVSSSASHTKAHAPSALLAPRHAMPQPTFRRSAFSSFSHLTAERASCLAVNLRLNTCARECGGAGVPGSGCVRGNWTYVHGCIGCSMTQVEKTCVRADAQTGGPARHLPLPDQPPPSSIPPYAALRKRLLSYTRACTECKQGTQAPTRGRDPQATPES